MKTRKSFTLRELAEILQASWSGDPDHRVEGVCDLEGAGPGDLSFLANLRYRDAMARSKAGIICLAPAMAPPDGRNYLLVEEPSRVFQRAAELLLDLSQGTGFTGIHPTAVIHPSAHLGAEVSIGPYTVIDRDVQIGDYTTIASHVTVGYETIIGTHCLLHPHSVVRERCILGNRVILQPGAMIGSCGFGYVVDEKGRYEKLAQMGVVILDDDVEIGAATTIDRARFGITRIGRGTKIDNLVQIAHNVQLGPHNIIVSQTGIAGSTQTEEYVTLGGQVGVVGHVTIGKHVTIASRGGVSKDMPKPGVYGGAPAVPMADYHRQTAYLRKMGHYVAEIKNLQAQLEELRQLVATLQAGIT